MPVSVTITSNYSFCQEGGWDYLIQLPSQIASTHTSNNSISVNSSNFNDALISPIRVEVEAWLSLKGKPNQLY